SFETGHRSRNTRRPPANDAVARCIPIRTDVHVPVRFSRRAFAEIEATGLTIRQAHQHESSSAKISGVGMGNRESESYCDCRGYGITSALQNRQTGIRGDWLLRDHHAMPGLNRLFRAKDSCE